MPKARLVLVLMLAMVGTTYARPAAPATIDEAIKAAAIANKPLVVEFSASWCGPCLVFEQEILPMPPVKRALGDVVFVHFDSESPSGVAAAARYSHITGLPTFLVIDSHGVEKKRREGLLDVEAFVALLGDARQSVAPHVATTAP